MTKVKFIEVGRYKESWEVECTEVTYEFLYREVKKVLASDIIDFTDDGDIIVGAGFRTVGKYEVIEEE